jgi:hypothetical protein
MEGREERGVKGEREEKREEKREETREEKREWNREVVREDQREKACKQTGPRLVVFAIVIHVLLRAALLSG